MLEIIVTLTEMVEMIKRDITEDREMMYTKIFEDENNWYLLRKDNSWSKVYKEGAYEWLMDELAESYWEKFYNLNCFTLTDDELDTVEFHNTSTEIVMTINTDKQVDLPHLA